MLRVLGGYKAVSVVGHGGLHRCGWPVVMSSIQPLHSEAARVGLDDYADASFTWCHWRLDHHPSDNSRPWVGIFHHPVTVNPPGVWSLDWTETVQDTLNSKSFAAREKSLVGCVAMCPVLAATLEAELGKPVLLLSHPTETLVPKWDRRVAATMRSLWSVGHYLRDTRLIFRASVPKDWSLSRMAPRNHWCRAQDAMLKDRLGDGEFFDRAVAETPHLRAEEYDEKMQHSVLLSHTIGCAANNVTVEAIARATPIITNRTASAEWYLGAEYPLFYDDTTEIHDILADRDRIVSAHRYMLRLDLRRYDVNYFATELNRWCNALR